MTRSMHNLLRYGGITRKGGPSFFEDALARATRAQLMSALRSLSKPDAQYKFTALGYRTEMIRARLLAMQDGDK